MNNVFLAFYLAVKEVLRNRGRFLLVSLVIALITLLVLFIAALGEGLANGKRMRLTLRLFIVLSHGGAVTAVALTTMDILIRGIPEGRQISSREEVVRRPNPDGLREAMEALDLPVSQLFGSIQAWGVELDDGSRGA